MPRGNFHRWTPQEDARLRHLREVMRLEWDIIGERFELTDGAVLGRYRWLTETREERSARLERTRDNNRKRVRRQREQAAERRAAAVIENRSDDLRIEQARGLLPRDLTGELLGDPPVGRSALDIKQGTYVG